MVALLRSDKKFRRNT